MASLTLPTLEYDQNVHVISLRRLDELEIYYEPDRRDAFFSDVMQTGQPSSLPVLNGATAGRRCSAMAAEDLSSFLAVPIICNAALSGALTVAQRQSRNWTQADLECLQKWAKSLEIAVCVNSESEISSYRRMASDQFSR